MTATNDPWERWMRGWLPAMGLLAVGVMTFIVSISLGRGWGGQIITILLGAVVCRYCMARSLRHVRRFGLLGWTRPRWWFELASMLWVLTMLVVSRLLSGCDVPANNVGGGQNIVGDAMLRLLGCAFVGAVALSAVGYGLSLGYLRKPRGDAHACVSWFFGFTVFIGLGCALVPQGAFVEDIALGFVAVAAVAAILAGVIALRDHFRQRRLPADS